MRKSRKLWKRLAIGLLTLVVLLLLFIVAFIFNPFEGSVRDVRDLVPREVDFFLRKTELQGDFVTKGGQLDFGQNGLPEPLFWEDMTSTRAWSEFEQGPMMRGVNRDYSRMLQGAADGLKAFQQNSGGFVDLARDLVGQEVVIAGYFEDRTGANARPLQQPWWCAYTRVSWRVRAGWGLARWSLVQDQAKSGGVEITNDGDLLAIRLQTGETFYAARHLDCLMIANEKRLLDQAGRLSLGSEEEEPFGQSAKYTDGVVQQVDHWMDKKRAEDPSRLEFSLATNTMDGFRRFAQSWPNPQNRDSMNERVLASFVNLKGWNSVSGALVFEPRTLTSIGEVVLNSHMHSPFQSTFYQAEKQSREDWLDPFLRMVPESACAAAALRMPIGEFLNSMFHALLPDEQQVLDDSLRRCQFNGQQLSGFSDFVNRIQIAFLPRSGFVFRRNQSDPDIKVVARSPVPQIAWVFWLRPGGALAAEGVLDMLRKYRRVFDFDPVYHLPIEGLPQEPVSEFCNPQIPGTGEMAAIVFPPEFFVVSNSGPLIKDILRARNSQVRSLLVNDQYQRFNREMTQSINGFVWVSGRNLIPVLDDYRAASDSRSQMVDPVWMAENRATAEETVRRTQYSRYPSLSAIPQSMKQPGGEFDEAVNTWLREQWSKGATGLSSTDLPAIDQMKAAANLLDSAFVQLDLRNNYIRFLTKTVMRW